MSSFASKITKQSVYKSRGTSVQGSLGGVHCYEMDDGVATFVDSSQEVNNPGQLSWDASSRVFTTPISSTDDYLKVFSVANTGRISLLAEGVARPGGHYKCGSFSPDDAYFVAGSQSTPYMHFYNCFAYDTDTEFAVLVLSPGGEPRLQTWVKAE